jgi:hypothetical protein
VSWDIPYRVKRPKQEFPPLRKKKQTSFLPVQAFSAKQGVNPDAGVRTAVADNLDEAEAAFRAAGERAVGLNPRDGAAAKVT